MASTYYDREAIIASIGTTAHWFKIGSTGTGTTSQKKWKAIEILINSTGSTGWVRRDGSAASSTGAQGNVIIPKARTNSGPIPKLIPYSTKISIKASAAATAYVRGIPRSLID
jgi:hypothetical protein